MIPFIHYNIKVLNIFNDKIINNNKEELVHYYQKYRKIIIMNENHFYNACSHCNLDNVRFIYKHLQNTYVDFKQALFHCIEQENEDVFRWLITKCTFERESMLGFLIYCIIQKNSFMFKIIHTYFNKPLSENNNELLKLALKKGNLELSTYIFNQLNYTLNARSLIYFKYACYSNNPNVIHFINSKFNFYDTLINDQETKLFLYDLCKNGYYHS